MIALSDVLLIPITILGLLYFILKKRNIDFFTLSFFSSVIYFSPSYTSMFSSTDFNIMVSLYHLIVLSLIITFTFIYDFFYKPKYLIANKKKVQLKNFNNSKLESAEIILYIFLIVISLIFIFLRLDQIFGTGKPNYGREYAVFSVVVPLSFIYSFYKKRIMITILIVGLILIDIIAGNRELTVFSIFGLGMFFSYKIGRIRLIKYYRIIFGIISLTTILLIYKGIYRAIKAGQYDLVLNRLTDSSYWVDSFIYGEPMTTQSILDRVLSYHYIYDGKYLINFLYSLVPFTRAWGFEPDTPGMFINQYVFADVNYKGVASNIWAEGHLIGGFELFFIYALIYSLLPILFNKAMFKTQHPLLKSIICVSGVIFFFFIHRSGLDYNIALQLRLWGIGFSLIVIPYLFKNQKLKF